MRTSLLFPLSSLLLLSSACMVGPNYKRPAAPQTPAYKEPAPEGWKEAQPNDGAIKGKWWELYNDPQLNALEEQVSISNQNVLAAEANFRAARYAVGIARAGLFPDADLPVDPQGRRTHFGRRIQRQQFHARFADGEGSAERTSSLSLCSTTSGVRVTAIGGRLLRKMRP